MADYKLVYENAEKIYGSETGVPAYKEDGTVDTDIDTFIVDRENLEGHKLVYGKKVDDEMVIYVSESGIPAAGDKTIAKVQEQAECGIKHDYTDIEEPKDDKCDTCGKAGHTWDEGEETKAPTCTEAGEKTYKCIVEGCDATKTAEIPATGHNYENGECTVCGEKEETPATPAE